MDSIVSKEEFIRRLESEATLYASDLRDINFNWEKYALIAESVLPNVPRLGMFSTSTKKQKVYRDIKTLILKACEKENPKIDCEGMVQLIIEYSSKSYRRASDAHVDGVVERLDQGSSDFIKPYLGLALFLGVAGLTILLETLNWADESTITILKALLFVICIALLIKR